MRRTAMAMAVAVVLGAGAAGAQRADTLADIRQGLAALSGEIRALERELAATGGGGDRGGGAAAGAGTLQRVDAIEAELQRLTGLTEELQFRIEAIVRDGTNRIGDLEFRLCELEPGCDIGALGATPPLGGDAGAEAVPPAPAAPAPPDGGRAAPQLAVGEQAGFDAGVAAFEAGEWAEAADLFAAHVETYPGGPLSAE